MSQRMPGTLFFKKKKKQKECQELEPTEGRGHKPSELILIV
jgi:hypothetical protein